MNDKEKQVEEVREWLEEVISNMRIKIAEQRYSYNPDLPNTKDIADQILFHPKLAILDDDQRLPEIPRFSYSYADYLRGQSDILQANFRRIIPREVKE